MTLVLLALVGRISELRNENSALRHKAARSQEEAALRATTIANDLMLRTREAELSYDRLITAVRMLAADRDFADRAARRRLLELLVEDP